MQKSFCIALRLSIGRCRAAACSRSCHAQRRRLLRLFDVDTIIGKRRLLLVHEEVACRELLHWARLDAEVRQRQAPRGLDLHGRVDALEPHQVSRHPRRGYQTDDRSARQRNRLWCRDSQGLIANRLEDKLCELLLRVGLGSSQRVGFAGGGRVAHRCHDGLGNVVHKDGLHLGLPAVNKGKEWQVTREYRLPVEELVLVAKHRSGTQDGHGGKPLFHCQLPNSLAPQESAFRHGAGTKCGHVDEAIHALFRAHF
mmetsp:Transcript_13072/g.42836  ORF Transcript_13072/g.42836 Transcript_13072/m.42836 type:complete len:255 (-) Transcript_13072:443-1207(-)